MAEQPDIRPWVHLHLVPEIGAVTFRRLTARFGSPEAALRATASELREVEGVGAVRAGAIVRGRDAADPDAEIARAARAGVRIVTSESPDYPGPLKYIHDPPAVLYVKGTLAAGDSLAVAVVGSRECTSYGLEQSERLAAAMAGAGVTVVSGLAKGIDTAAHKGAISVRGRTIAVLGGGLDHVYPHENRPLAEKIAGGFGAVVSEFPMAARPQPHHFPMRNRIISGLSLGVLVVEAPVQSGSLITAHSAVEQNREVMAVPGRVDTQFSKGCHALIKQGAKLVESLEDILDALGEAGRLLREAIAMDTVVLPTLPGLPDKSLPAPVVPAAPAAPPPPAAKLPLSDAERAVYEALANDAAQVDVIVRQTNLPAAVVNTTLTRLELKGLIRPEPGGRFARRR